MVENKDIHGNDAVVGAVKRKQLKDFQFHQFCNRTLSDLRTHWIFKENGIVFESTFNLIPIERSLTAEVQLGGNATVSTHDLHGAYDKAYNDKFKDLSCKVLSMQKGALERWVIVYEAVPGLNQKLKAMVDKMQQQLARLYGVSIATPNVVEVRELQQ